MNGKKAKALRRLARTLNLPEENSYAPVGELKRRPAIVDHGRTYTAGLVRRPFALRACERRAYQEAKALYKGAAIETDTPIEPIPQEQPEFKEQVHESINQQPASPVYGPR